MELKPNQPNLNYIIDTVEITNVYTHLVKQITRNDRILIDNLLENCIPSMSSLTFSPTGGGGLYGLSTNYPDNWKTQTAE